ncbi:hypothetical protein [Burkholderia cenocepacia]|uniref:Uncharacterized protein n=1 Tax=Burkholderia cenocepacia TaxID=95486 RepID=A0A3S9N5Y0_9BURK|nr:hypothetical protein [Burkholderia cenocepacia]AZQ51091.1 hypothetical protein D5R55_08795 [Burkholderia cenocepacia]
MTTGGGGIAVIFFMLLITYILFGRGDRKSFYVKFSYWIKSTLLTAVALFSWFSYIDPSMFNWPWALISLVLSGLFCFGREIAPAML